MILHNNYNIFDKKILLFFNRSYKELTFFSKLYQYIIHFISKLKTYARQNQRRPPFLKLHPFPLYILRTYSSFAIAISREYSISYLTSVNVSELTDDGRCVWCAVRNSSAYGFGSPFGSPIEF